MSGPESSPNFDWLKKELGHETSGSGGNDSSTKLAGQADNREPANFNFQEESPPKDTSDQKTPSDSSLDDFDHIPDSPDDASDGTTVIIPKKSFGSDAQSSPADSMLNPLQHAPEDPFENLTTEEFSSPAPSGQTPSDAAGTAPPDQSDEQAPKSDTTPSSSSSPAAQPIPEIPAPADTETFPDFSKITDSSTAPQTSADVPDLNANDEVNSPADDVPQTTGTPSEQFSQLESNDSPSIQADNAVIHDDIASQTPKDGLTEVLRPEDLEKARAERTAMEALQGGSTLAASITAGNATGTPVSSHKTSSTGNQTATSSLSNRRMVIIILASYASAITIAFLLLLFSKNGDANPHQLESLPDIPAEKVDSLTYVPPNIKLPPGHTLRIGEKQRFGNILVEPLAIVREPASFVHYTGNDKRTRPATAPLWKLKVRLTNVSKDQEIAPLDRRLVLRWVTNENHQQEFTNYFITQRNADSRDAHAVQLYRLPLASEWDLVGQDLGKTLKPGESYETYLASAEEGLDNLPNDLVWRVQIRKGYSPKGNGVTTIFEVAFNKKDVTG